jgi:hypothetical protein
VKVNRLENRLLKIEGELVRGKKLLEAKKRDLKKASGKLARYNQKRALEGGRKHRGAQGSPRRSGRISLIA